MFCTIQKDALSLYQLRTIKDTTMKQLIINMGEFNEWKGCIALYFTVKDQIAIKKEFGFTGDTKMSDVKKALNI